VKSGKVTEKIVFILFSMQKQVVFSLNTNCFPMKNSLFLTRKQIKNCSQNKMKTK